MGSAAASGLGRRLTVALGGAERTRRHHRPRRDPRAERRRRRDRRRVGERAPVGPAHHEHRHRPARRGQLPRRRGRVAAVRRARRPRDADAHRSALDHRASGASRCSGARPPRTSSELLWTRLFLGAVTASAGPLVASLVGDWFGSWERGRIYGVILAGEYVGAGIGFAVTGNIAALSWRAAFVILALPAFVLALVVWRLPRARARRQGRARVRQGASSTRAAGPVPGGAPRRPTRSGSRASAASCPIPSSSSSPRCGTAHEPRGAPPATCCACGRTSILIAASACGYYFLAGLQTFGLEFSKDQYGIDQALASSLLLVVGVGSLAGVLAGGTLGDWLLKRGVLNGRVWTPAVAAALHDGALRAGDPHPRPR